MEPVSAYIITLITAFLFLMLAVLSAHVIQFERSPRPRDPRRRRVWFWVLAMANPSVAFSLGYFVFKPDSSIVVVGRYMTALSIGTVVGFVVYIAAGFILSRMFRKSKIVHWF